MPLLQYFITQRAPLTFNHLWGVSSPTFMSDNHKPNKKKQAYISIRITNLGLSDVKKNQIHEMKGLINWFIIRLTGSGYCSLLTHVRILLCLLLTLWLINNLSTRDWAWILSPLRKGPALDIFRGQHTLISFSNLGFHHLCCFVNTYVFFILEKCHNTVSNLIKLHKMVM